jgi:prolipoprotein diacylglyceryl transferase
VFPPLADALAPGIVLAQAIGRFGNWFNQELFGKPTDLPWALEIPDVTKRPAGYEQYQTFHPTFLYESLWDLGVLGLLLWADRRFTMGHGRVFALYVAAYCSGRVWIEALRIDPVEANDVFGLRLNVWTSILLFVLATTYLLVSARRRPGREQRVLREDEQGSTTADPSPHVG